MDLLGRDDLERSPVVANCRMNRERVLDGSNGYGRDLGFAPLDFLRARQAEGGDVAWLDLCCGTGRALIAAGEIAQAEGWGDRLAIVGVDLVGRFDRLDPGCTHLTLVVASVEVWKPNRTFDLITCVHGLHYVGDKLGVIARAVALLTPDGRFAAHLDPVNLKLAGGRAGGRWGLAALRRAGIAYDRRRRMVGCLGPRAVANPGRYLGADDRAGPNRTGQPAVDAYYQPTAATVAET